MGSVFGNSIKLTLFGESHGAAVGAVLDGLPPGLKVDAEYIAAEMNKRRARGAYSTGRQEADVPEFVSGVKNGFTEGTPLAVIIRTTDARPQDYEAQGGAGSGLKTGSAAQEKPFIPRPSQSDFTAQAKYLGFQDASGGGHFSGRLTAPIVAVCAVVRQALEAKGIFIGTHILMLGELTDRPFSPDPTEEIKALAGPQFPVLSEEKIKEFKGAIESIGAEGDSLGGVLETAVAGLEAGIGEPFFSSIESELARALFSIPGARGVEFGAGFDIAKMRGSQANDAFSVKDGRVVTTTNNSGGINGGVSNGMPIVFRTAFRPTPSISIPQKSVDLNTMTETELVISGRHDPAFIHRARPVVDGLTALVLADFLAQRYGYMWLRNE